MDNLFFLFTLITSTNHTDNDLVMDVEIFCLYQKVVLLSYHKVRSGWLNHKLGVAICSCNDGLRPVIFKIEATDIESVIDYEPVQ